MKTDKSKINKGYVAHLLIIYKFKECNGCPQIPSICNMITSGNHKICPCIECLVKPICREHCQEYMDIFSVACGCSINIREKPTKKVI